MTANLLIIDALPQSRAMVNAHLELAGYQTRTAADGFRALDCIQEQDFELVLADLRAPGPGGLELLHAARRRSPGTEVVFVAGGDDQGLAAECLRAGAFDLLQKPINTYDLLSTVSRALERNHLRAAAVVHEANLGRLSAGVVHQLNNPLTGLLTDLTLLNEALVSLEDLAALSTRPDMPAELQRVVTALGGPEGVMTLRRAASDATASARQVRRIAQDLKLLARPGRTAPFDLNDAARAALRLERGALRRAGVAVSATLDGALTVSGSAGRVCQLFMNVLGVAARAARGGSAPSMTLRSRTEGGQAVVDLLLQAPGRAGTLDIGHEPSLAVSRDIARAHGGDLAVSSGSQGAAYTVTLPMW